MRTRPIFRIPSLALLITALGVSSAWGAKSKPRGAVETYPAVDQNPMEASASAVSGTPGQSAGVAPANQERPTPPSHGNVMTSEATASAAAARWQKAPYDSVPSSQADSIAKRLTLVEALLRKYGRAYDYRTLTVKDLESILSYLDDESSRDEVSSH